MKARPILMHARSIQNLLAGRKTQTRRIVKPQPPEDCGQLIVENIYPTVTDRHGEDQPGAEAFGVTCESGEWCLPCPYGKPGDLLWVRETWAHYQTVDHIRRQSGAAFSEVSDGLAGYRADGFDTISDFKRHVAAMGDVAQEAVVVNKDRWRPAIHMPRWASRLTLELTDVRVERVQDISTDDAVAEGCTPGREDENGAQEPWGRLGFRYLWDDTNGPGAWARNDWVWVLAFKVHRINVDEYIQRVTAHETGCRPFREATR